MNPQSKGDYNNKNDDSNRRRTKAIATAIPMAGIIVAAAFVSGPFFFIGSSYPQAMAQQNNTMTPSELNGSTSADGDNNSTTIGGSNSNVQSSACAEIQTGGTFDEGVTVGGTSAADDYDADSEGEDNADTTGTTDATSITTAEGGGNQPTADLRDFIEEACIALQVDDRQGALMYLDMALNALGGDSTQGGITNTPSGITNGTTTATSDD
ncbi:MAG TPA: hypothetical protein VE732_01110 [Nitrososphaera sp.]|nr:hypothetical protein [Nitrososphaera sp.]